MLSYIERYGEDADGNRGEHRVVYELEPSDRAEILEYIFTHYPEEEGYYKGEYLVELYDSISDELIEFYVDYEDWINK
jgi:hypothetical protein